MKRKADEDKEKEAKKVDVLSDLKKDADDAPVETTIEQLPTELKVLIFSSLDAKTLSTAGLVCREWNVLSQDPWFWKEKIKVHFPYLVETHEEDYMNDPRELYRLEYGLYKDEIALEQNPFGLQQLLDALSGHLSQIESDAGLDEQSKQTLYAHAVANGHYHGLKLLETRGAALIMSMEKGHLPVVQYLLEYASDISPGDKVRVLSDAAKKGYVKVVMYLIEHVADISPLTKHEAFCDASASGHLSVVQYLLEHLPDISAHTKGRAFYDAAANGHLPVVQYLLKHASDISSQDKAQALRNAAASGHLPVVQYLLEHASGISSWDKAQALRNAAASGYVPVVQISPGTCN